MKRFKLRLSKLGNGMITDTQKRDDLYFDKEFLDATLPKAIEWLNTLNEENEQLKIQLQNTSDQRDEFHCGARENANRVGKLKKENDQLQQLNKRLRKKIQKERTSFMKTHERWSKEAETKIKELSEENEQLKKQRAELFIRERDTKNDWRELKQENKQLKAHNQYLFKLLEDNGVIIELMKGDVE